MEALRTHPHPHLRKGRVGDFDLLDVLTKTISKKIARDALGLNVNCSTSSNGASDRPGYGSNHEGGIPGRARTS